MPLTPFLIVPNPQTVINSSDCSGQNPQQGYNYTKSQADGWGWVVGLEPLTADACLPDACVHYFGINGDTGCGVGSVTIPWPPASNKYRFSQTFAGTPITPNKATIKLYNFKNQ